MKCMESKTTVVSVSWKEKDHPVWGILKLMLQGAILALVLANTATKFDAGEVKTIAIALLSNAALESVNARRKS